MANDSVARALSIVAIGSGGGGTSDFEQLTNRPKYNNAVMDKDTNIPEVKTATWDGKQDAISDLSTIRSGAALGATAVQPESGKGLFSGDYEDLTNKPTIPTVPTIDNKTIKQNAVTGQLETTVGGWKEHHIDDYATISKSSSSEWDFYDVDLATYIYNHYDRGTSYTLPFTYTVIEGQTDPEITSVVWTPSSKSSSKIGQVGDLRVNYEGGSYHNIELYAQTSDGKIHMYESSSGLGSKIQSWSFDFGYTIEWDEYHQIDSNYVDIYLKHIGRGSTIVLDDEGKLQIKADADAPLSFEDINFTDFKSRQFKLNYGRGLKSDKNNAWDFLRTDLGNRIWTNCLVCEGETSNQFLNIPIPGSSTVKKIVVWNGTHTGNMIKKYFDTAYDSFPTSSTLCFMSQGRLYINRENTTTSRIITPQNIKKNSFTHNNYLVETLGDDSITRYYQDWVGIHRITDTDTQSVYYCCGDVNSDAVSVVIDVVPIWWPYAPAILDEARAHVEYNRFEPELVYPDQPSTAGDYVLECDVSGGTASYSWEEKESYTAGTGISISNGVISNTQTPGTVVSGTNDGTNWNTITIDGTTKAIPQGGGASYTAGNGIDITNNVISTKPVLITIEVSQVVSMDPIEIQFTDAQAALFENENIMSYELDLTQLGIAKTYWDKSYFDSGFYQLNCQVSRREHGTIIYESSTKKGLYRADFVVPSAGTGISISGATVSNTGVLSVNGATGAISVPQMTYDSATGTLVITA